MKEGDKRGRALAVRYKQYALNFFAMLKFNAIYIWLRSYEVVT
tara:strand:+ start:3673 stop:3801 length:129 start_codon:yes stop_codon:yes gene_type:complete